MSLVLSLSDEARAAGRESELQALAASENRLSDFTVSRKTFASLPDKVTNPAMKISSFSIVISILGGGGGGGGGGGTTIELRRRRRRRRENNIIEEEEEEEGQQYN